MISNFGVQNSFPTLKKEEKNVVKVAAIVPVNHNLPTKHAVRLN